MTPPLTRARAACLFLLVLLSAVLLPLALPSEFFGMACRLFGGSPDESLYWGNAALGVVCIAPVFYAVAMAPSFGFASLLGMLFGAVSTALANYWLSFFQGYSFWTFGGVIVAYTGIMALVFPFLRGFSRLRTPYRPFILAAAWTVYEYFKSVGFLGYPWGLIAYPVGQLLPLYQFIDATGIWGLSFLMALINALVAEGALVCRGAVPRRGLRPVPGLLRRQIVFGAFLLACALCYGFIRLALPIPSRSTASILIVQQNSDPWDAGKESAESLRINLALTAEGIAASPQPPDLAVWSESAISTVAVDDRNRLVPTKNELQPGVARMGVPVLFGGVVVVSYKKQLAMNAAILVSKEGGLVDTYGKIHPVPFAESIPFFENPAVQWFFRNVVNIWLPWTVGNRFTIFSVPTRGGGILSFGTPICFEDGFSDLCRQYFLRGADVLLNITNDSWSKTWSSEIQHFVVARFRAVENRRVLVRATNGGLSAVVGPWGEIRERMPLFVRGSQTVEVPLSGERGLTPYCLFGDWLPKAFIALLAILLALDAFPARKRPSGRTGTRR